ncbi:MAG: nucleotidyltransferase family protein [Alphaproteobacteria bacterium]
MDPLLRILAAPTTMPSLTAVEWTSVMQRARRRALLGKLGVLAQDAGVLDELPPAVQRQFLSMMRLADHNAEHLKAEAFLLLHTLRDDAPPVVFLKGAAYALLGLQADRGRVSSDIDILVPRDRINGVEAALQQANWDPMKLSAYDQDYYRRWMHEIPPLRHRIRATVIDVHHTILPLTGRITPDPVALIDAVTAINVEGRTALVPCPEDLVIHAAVHLFQDGDLSERLRDLLDIKQMVAAFSADESFWGRLADRAALHESVRPLFYALYFARSMLKAEVPDAVLEGWRGAPGPMARAVMNLLVPTALVPSVPDRAPPFAGLARWLLFLRSHWLRMPPLLLARHLTIKAFRNLGDRFRR